MLRTAMLLLPVLPVLLVLLTLVLLMVILRVQLTLVQRVLCLRVQVPRVMERHLLLAWQQLLVLLLRASLLLPPLLLPLALLLQASLLLLDSLLLLPHLLLLPLLLSPTLCQECRCISGVQAQRGLLTQSHGTCGSGHHCRVQFDGIYHCKGGRRKGWRKG
jgi:hypothetical protein